MRKEVEETYHNNNDDKPSNNTALQDIHSSFIKDVDNEEDVNKRKELNQMLLTENTVKCKTEATNNVLEPDFSALEALPLEEQVNFMKQVSKLKGRIDLILAQIQRTPKHFSKQ